MQTRSRRQLTGHIATVSVLGLLTAAFVTLPYAADAGNILQKGTLTYKTPFGFGELVKRLTAAIAKNKMGLVTQASASAGAWGRGIKIPGNMIVGVYRNDFAVRMLEASVPAGIEAPIRFYLTANADGTATLIYRTPSSLFAPYGSAKMNAIAAELDKIFANIARDAIAPGGK